MPVIYVDVLFFINFFMTFLLLMLTGKLIKREPKLWRSLLGGALGGVYSLTILIENTPFFITYGGKFLSALLIVFAAFGFVSVKKYVRTVLIFFFSGLVLLGIIVGIWLVFKPPGVVVNNSVVYFDVPARVLVFSAAGAYVIASAVVRIHNRVTAKREMYDLTISYGGKTVHTYALSDSGNKLREPFSSSPVIVVKRSLFNGVSGQRVVPVKTVSGEGILEAFKPDLVTVKLNGKSVSVTDVYVALSDSFGSDDYCAVINPSIINV